MEKRVLFTRGLLLILLLQLVSAEIDLEVEYVGETPVIIKEIPASFNYPVEITNNGSTQEFRFYNLLGFEMEPSGRIEIPGNGKTTLINFTFTPQREFETDGFFTFKYGIQGKDYTEDLQEKVVLEVVSLKDSFEIGSGKLYPEENSLDIFVENQLDYKFENIKASFESPFFEFEEDFTLNPREKKSFNVEIDPSEMKEMKAGFHTLISTIQYKDTETEIQGVINFVEKNLINTDTTDSGFFINTKTITKTNEGNVDSDVEINVKKNILSRLFTTLHPNPDIVERDGFSVYYSWTEDLKPGETLDVTVRTNWLFPLVIIVLVVLVVIYVKKYTRRDVMVRKKVSFVRTKGGQFALKVTIYLKAAKYLSRVNLKDRVPSILNIYERKFGGEQPRRVSEKTIEWEFDKMDEGERRIISYIIHSKVGVIGRFALPRALAVYEREGEIKETTSNKPYFIAEPSVSKKEKEDDED